MKILILGASGLIGHKLYQELKPRFDQVRGLVRRSREEMSQFGLFEEEDMIYDVDVLEFKKLTGIITALKSDVVLNCVGITKRKEEIEDPLLAIETNALFPHKLARWAGDNGVRVIHFSTDCVFDGTEGPYNEDSPTTGKDAYGRTKALGEIRYDHSLTIRSSFIGQEILGKTELLEWFLNQPNDQIRGFTEAWYSGVSTKVMARVVGDIIEHHPDLGGLYQLAIPEPISKYDLLQKAREAYEVDVEIIPDSSFSIKPTLDGSRLAEKLQLRVPAWDDMMQELSTEKNQYQ